MGASNMNHSAMGAGASNMDHSAMDHSATGGMDNSSMGASNMDHSAMDHSATGDMDHSAMGASNMDYSAMGASNMSHASMPMGAHADHGFRLWLTRDRQRIGSSYKKARYVEFTDATFTTRKVRPATEEHLGILGPALRAEVHDTMLIHFKNFLSVPVSMHPHGVSYTKDHEGAPYEHPHGASYKHDRHPMHLPGGVHIGDAVAPGGVHIYNWTVPEEAAFGPTSSRVWLYHSHTDETMDTNTGLVGVIIIYKSGVFDAEKNRPYDVDRELVTVFHIFDETSSHYFAQNVQQSLNASGDLTAASLAQLVEDEKFVESNRMHAINGRVYGNLPGLSMREGERVRWYITALGTQLDMHSGHWHGNVVLLNGMATDVVNVMPGTMLTADMIPRNVGRWLYHCHVDHHIHGGMIAFYDVLAAKVSDRMYEWADFHRSVGPGRWNEVEEEPPTSSAAGHVPFSFTLFYSFAILVALHFL
jgi:hypothetical protein